VSSLLFVSVVVAWAVYLIPKAVQHHDEAVRGRSIERFSKSMRVLARREPVNRRDARLVVQPGRGPAAPVVTSKGGLSPEAQRRREAARRATRRRRRVLGTLLLALAVVVTTAAFSLHSWWYVAIPATLIAAWLVMCRVMVKGERGSYSTQVRYVTPTAPAAPSAPSTAKSDDQVGEAFAEAHTDAHGMPVVRDPHLWDPVPTTLPTYVDKEPAARRTVSTIDLDSTGVFSAGRSEADSALAREADEAERARKAARAEAQRRATGS